MRSTVLLLLLAGCASAPVVSGSDSAPQQTAIFTSPQTGTLMTDAARAEAVEIDAPPEAVWLAVKKVYGDLAIPVTVDNLPGHQLGNPDFFKSRQLGGQPMHLLVDCGNGMTGPNASTFRIFMSSLTDVNPNGKGGSKLQTTFTARGQDITGGSSDRIPCGSSGRFEQMILSRVKTALGK